MECDVDTSLVWLRADLERRAARVDAEARVQLAVGLGATGVATAAAVGAAVLCDAIASTVGAGGLAAALLWWCTGPLVAAAGAAITVTLADSALAARRRFARVERSQPPSGDGSR